MPARRTDRNFLETKPMRTDPFTDTWMFLIGRQPDQLALGPWRWLLVALFIAALAASVWIAWVNWRADPAMGGARRDRRQPCLKWHANQLQCELNEAVEFAQRLISVSVRDPSATIADLRPSGRRRR